MKILMLTDYFAPHVGGVEHAVRAVAARLVQQGHSVHILTLNTDFAPELEELEDVTVHRARSLEITRLIGMQSVWSIAAIRALRRIAREVQPDVIHAHSIFNSTSLLAAALKRRLGCPLVLTMHLGALDGIAGAARIAASAWEQTFGRFILRASDRVIAVSQAVADHAATLGYPSPLTSVIPNGVDLERFFPGGSARSSSRARIALVGRLIFNKGPRYLLDAAPHVLIAHPNAEFILAGDGPLRADLERRVYELGLERAVTFLGERTDVPEVLRGCDMLVRPSLTEGLPLTVLEAMACEVPVIATPVGGTAEIVHHESTGLLIRPDSVDDLSMAINRLLEDAPLARRLARGGRALVERSHDWSVIARQTADVYQELVGTSGLSRPAEERPLTPVRSAA